MDHSGNYVRTALPLLLSLLQRGLGERVHLLAHSLAPDLEVRLLGTVMVYRLMQNSIIDYSCATDPVLSSHDDDYKHIKMLILKVNTN